MKIPYQRVHTEIPNRYTTLIFLYNNQPWSDAFLAERGGVSSTKMMTIRRTTRTTATMTMMTTMTTRTTSAVNNNGNSKDDNDNLIL